VSFLASSGFIIFTCQRVGRINVIDFMTVVQEQDSSTAFADLRTASVENPEQVCHEVEGAEFRIFCPFFQIVTDPQVLHAPEDWITRLAARFSWLDSITAEQDSRSVETRSQAAYFEFLEMYVTGLCFGAAEYSIEPSFGPPTKVALNEDRRRGGLDWAYLGDTMTGSLRIKSVRGLLQDVFSKNISGHFIETGVWRGGMSIFARGVIRAMNQTHRKSFVCDSFRGLPPGDRDLDNQDKGWDNMPYLAVADEIVAGNFKAAGVLDPNVIFVKGFFKDSMPELAKMIDSLAIMRLDGDMYESTVDVLYHLYGKLSIGGYVIMDDWTGFPSRTACLDFFSAHGISPSVILVDDLSAYWQKNEHVDIQYWRYEQLKFKSEA